MYHRLLLLAVIVNTAEMDHSCAPAEIAKPYTFTYTFSNNAGTFFWKKNGIDIVLCEHDMCTVAVQANNNIYEATMSNRTTTLTIKAVTRESGGTYSFGSETYDSFTCSLRVYEVNPLCDPGEVTQPYTMTYNFGNVSRPIVWKKGAVNIVVCLVSNCTLLTDPGIYEATRSGMSTTLTIKAVTTNSGGHYTCDDERFHCNFRVYAKPNVVICQDPEFQTETNEIAVVCTVLGVYPSPVCQFTWIIDNIESHTIQKSLVEYSNLTGSGDPSYFNQKCSLKIPAQNFTRGKHEFQLLAYPDVTGQVIDTVYGKKSTQTYPKYVADPSITLACSRTSIQEGKQFSCTCNETANKFILPNTTLFYGAAMVSSALQQVTATVTARRNTLELICQAELPDGTKANKTQTVQVYYGPSIVLMGVIYNGTESDVISLCAGSLTVKVTCSAPVTDVSPGVKYQFYSNLTDTPSALSNVSAVNYTVTSGGLFYFLCTGNNSLDSSLSATSTNKIIQVTAPPSPPVIENYQKGGTSFIGAGDQLTVQEGVARIRCRVEGGCPSVSSLQLECGSQIYTTKDNNVLYTDVNITRRMDGSNCSCTATHSSTCYRNNKAQTVLDVHFSGQIIIKMNSSVSISCQAEGNPSPSLSLRKEGQELQTSIDSTHISNPILTYHKAMVECLDTGVYTCHAETVDASADKTVTVYVQCAQQFRYHDSLSQRYKEQVNSTVLIYVPIFGYPEPIVTLNSNKYILSSESYKLTYIKEEPPYGTVSLVINIRNASFFQNYSLNINNSEGTLTYSFEITERGSEKGDSPSLDVGAIVGGIVAAVLVIIIIVVIVCLVKRKGASCRGKTDENTNNSMQTVYENDEPAKYRAAKVDTDSRDTKGSAYVLEELPETQVPENPHYEEIIDFRSDVPDKAVDYANQLSSNASAVEYENTVSGL